VGGYRSSNISSSISGSGSSSSSNVSGGVVVVIVVAAVVIVVVVVEFYKQGPCCTVGINQSVQYNGLERVRSTNSTWLGLW